MEQAKIDAYGDELYDALKDRTTVTPFTERESGITIEDAYQIQQRVINRRIEQDGERVVGKKNGSSARKSASPARRCRTCSASTSRTSAI